MNSTSKNCRKEETLCRDPEGTVMPGLFESIGSAQEDPAELADLRATFIVLSPGPRKDLKSVQKKTEFPFPFVEDKDLNLAKQLKLVLAPGQIQPAIFAVNKSRQIEWMQYGRNGGYYGDKELQDYLDCEFDLAGVF